MNNNFFCYSNKMRHFIQSFGIYYISYGMNQNTNTRYWIFEKSERLDKIIQLYNSVKHLV
jgi:hypothetical protein